MGKSFRKYFFLWLLAFLLLAAVRPAKAGEEAGSLKTDTAFAHGEETPPLTGIRFAKEKLVMHDGQEKILRVTALPSGAKLPKLHFSSSDKRVALVNQAGKIKARHKGFTTITAVTEDGKYSASCLVKVRFYPKTISLNASKVVLYEREKLELKAKVRPVSSSSTNVTWTSSNPAVAVVGKKGTVLGKSIGTAVITAKTNLGGLTASCTVTVKEGAHWETVGGRQRYIYHGAPLKGYQRIGKYYYVFDSDGNMQTGMVQKGGTVYFIKEKNGRITQYRTGTMYYNADGSPRDFSLGYDIEAYYYGKQAAQRVTNSSMSQEQKLFACFSWAAAFPYLDTHEFVYQANWVPLFAFDCFLGQGGPCYSNAAAFAYMAKAIGYKNVYVCLDTATDADNAHCWAEVEGLCYDPLFYRVKGSRYYALPYSGWNEWPYVKVKLS